MSKRLQVLAAVKALIQAALPGPDVRGMDTDEAKPERVGPLGMVLVRSGDPGEPEIDLSPPTYHYDHFIPLELASYQSAGRSPQEITDEMLVAIGAAVEADRTLGGLVDYLDTIAPTDGETEVRGAQSLGWADAGLTASYSTTNPLT